MKNRKKRTVPLLIPLIIFILFVGINILESAENKSDEIIWLEFKLPPHYDAERKEIQEADKKRLDELRPLDLSNMNYEVLALVDIDRDGKYDEAFVLAEILKESKYAGEAWIAHYKKKGELWELLAPLHSNGDIYYIKSKEGRLSLITNGCGIRGHSLEIESYYAGPFNSPARNGRWIDMHKESEIMKVTSKIVYIVKKELAFEIHQAKQAYKKLTNIDYQYVLNIAGIFQDLNGDGKSDIIATLNNPKYLYVYPDGKQISTPNRFPILFCNAHEECEKYLLLNKGVNKWEKIPLGYTNCIGISNPNEKGIREIYTERSTAVWNGSTYKVISYKPNWMIKE